MNTFPELMVVLDVLIVQEKRALPHELVEMQNCALKYQFAADLINY